MIAKTLRLISLFVILTFSSEQILLAYPAGGETFLLSSPAGSPLLGEEEALLSPDFLSPENPSIGEFQGLPKPASLKLAGWFKKLFKKIAKFFQKVVQAIVKAIQKVTAFITKAFTAVFGRTIGGALAGIVNSVINILTSPVHIAYYASQGDWKGLLKYMGQTAIQVALLALNFIPGVGQALYGAFQFLLQGLFAVVKFLLAPLLQLAGALFSGVGSFIGGFSTGLGQFFSSVGTHLSSLGRSFASQARSFFQTGIKDLFQQIKLGSTSLKKLFESTLSKLKDQLNPVTYYKNLFNSVTQTLHNLTNQTGLSRLLQTVTEKLSIQIAQAQIDKSLEKSKMSSFLKGILSSVSNAALQGLGSSISRGGEISLPSQGTLETGRGRAPPTGLSGFFERITGALASVTGLITDALKDSAGFIKSIFISEKVSSDSLSPAFEDLFQEKLGQLDLDAEGNPYRLRLTQDLARIEYVPTGERPTQGIYSFDLDQGTRQILRIDPTTQAVLSQERIGNLETRSSSIDQFNQFRFGLSDALNKGIDYGIDSLIGPPDGLPAWAYITSYTIAHTAGDFLKGTADFINLGRDIPDIISSFKAGLRQGELGQAVKDYFTSGRFLTGQPFSIQTPNLSRATALSLGELGRASVVIGGIGGALRGVANSAESGLLRNLAGVARAFTAVPEVEVLKEDLIVYRHWGGKSAELGSPWFSAKPYSRAVNARRYLSLPEGNTAENVTAFKIPAGTTILRGKTASQVGEIGFGNYASGGGTQIYVSDPRVMTLIKHLRVKK